jgi:hypothetical protein
LLERLSWKSFVEKKTRTPGSKAMEVFYKNTKGDNYKKNKKNPQKQMGNTKQEMDLLMIQVLPRPFWRWVVLIIQGHNMAFASRDEDLNKWLQHFFKHLHV